MKTKRIRVGIIGVHPEKGWATIAHIPALQSLATHFEITAISSNDAERAERAADKFRIPHAFTTTYGLVTHPDVDLVVVAVRVPHHRELVTAAIEAGKNVFCEAPLGVDLDEATQLANRAKELGVHTFIGLQARAAPAINYVRDLIEDGYVGDVLSTTLVGSGINWGEEMEEKFAYTLDSKSGAGMLHVPFAHSIDAVLYALDTTMSTVTANLTVRRKSSRMTETGVELPMKTPDQIAVSGTLANGSFLASHFRGGLSRGTNFQFEVNGSKGDLIVTSPVGYVGIGGFRVQGVSGVAQGGQTPTIQDLTIPEKYGVSASHLGVAHNVALLYERLASDLTTGTHLSPSFDDAVVLQRLIATIESSDRSH